MKFSFKEVDARQPSPIVKLGPTTEDGTYGEAVIQIGGLLEPREFQGTTKDGKPFKTVHYELLAIPLEGIYIDAINKEEVVKKDPKSGRVVGKDLIPKTYNADELNEIMRERGNNYAIIRLSLSNYELIKRNMDSGKVNRGDVIKLEYIVRANGGVIVNKILKAEESYNEQGDA